MKQYVAPMILIFLGAATCAEADQYRTIGDSPKTRTDSLLRATLEPLRIHRAYSEDKLFEFIYDRDDKADSVTGTFTVMHYDSVFVAAKDDSILIVAAVLSLGDKIGAIALAGRIDGTDSVMFAESMIMFPPPFYSERVDDILDFSGDGIPDVAIRCYGGQTYQLFVYRWDVSGTLVPMRRFYADTTRPHGAGFFGRFGAGHSDIDGDGVPEITVADKESTGDFTSVIRYFKWDGELYQLLRSEFKSFRDGEVTTVYPDEE